MTTEKKILQVITEQKEYIKEFKTEKLVSRKEENLFVSTAIFTAVWA